MLKSHVTQKFLTFVLKQMQ